MKVNIIAWHCSEKEIECLERLGFEHNSIIDVDVPMLLMDIFNMGLNVMIGHRTDFKTKEEGIPIIGVADDFFHQR